MANSGTLILDELLNLPANAQQLLLDFASSVQPTPRLSSAQPNGDRAPDLGHQRRRRSARLDDTSQTLYYCLATVRSWCRRCASDDRTSLPWRSSTQPDRREEGIEARWRGDRSAHFAGPFVVQQRSRARSGVGARAESCPRNDSNHAVVDRTPRPANAQRSADARARASSSAPSTPTVSAARDVIREKSELLTKSHETSTRQSAKSSKSPPGKR